MKPYDLEDRLVQFAGESVLYLRTVVKDEAGRYYADQLLRSSGSAALHYGEAQGTDTTKDFIHKMANVNKELKESRVALKILNYLRMGSAKINGELREEVQELIAITAKMILNKK
jgi:four helix bundle protein